jgi:hypothetical protein
MSKETKKAKTADDKVTHHKPTPKQREEIDTVINSTVRKHFGKVVPKVSCIGQRHSSSKAGGQPYERYALENDFTCFVTGFVDGKFTVSISEKKLDPKSFTGKAYYARQARMAKRAADKAAEAKESK